MSEDKSPALIIGGGMAGMSVAAVLSDLGLKSIIVEQDRNLGGHINEHLTLFPDQRNASEVFSEKLELVENNPNVEIMTGSRIESISGEFGAFTVKVVPTDIDADDKKKTVEAKTIVIATGFEGMNADNIFEYSYSLHNNIITGLEFEKMIFDKAASGEKPGRPSDNAPPKSAAVIMCTGSRDEKHNEFCCEVGCRVGLNHALFLKDTFGPDIDVVVCYIDIRATGKDNENLYTRVREKGVRFIKSRPSEISKIDEDTAKFIVFDLITHKLLQIESDLIILETGLIPRNGQGAINEMLGLETDESGFLKSPDYFKPFCSTKKGVFIAGTAAGPKDLPGTISGAALTAAEVAKILKD